MKKIIKSLLLLVLSLTFLFSSIPLAFATTATEQVEPIFVLNSSNAQGAAVDSFRGSGNLYITMRETNRSVRIFVRIVSASSEDFDDTYYVAWTTPSGKVRYLTNVKGNGDKYYFDYTVAEKGTHTFYFLKWDSDTTKSFTASATIKDN